MAEWVPITDGFIAADVIRWKEKVYLNRPSRRGRAVKIGERMVAAEVLKGTDSKGWVRLLVRQCETLVELTVRKLPAYTNGAEIKRARKTIMKGEPERLLWSDESAREVVARETPPDPIAPTGAAGGKAPRPYRRRARKARPPGELPVPKP